jgi:ATP-dependent phosphofructokinase / diphosphate-dependent phosphofructokinase
VPKTIDNDLAATRYTFCFWTAIGTATEALDRLRDTAESHHRVMVLEVMGRDAGWIALHAGVSGAADVILIPEIPYRAERVAEEVEARRGRGQAFSIIVVAEGAKPHGGEKSYVEAVPRTGAPRLGGAGERLARELAALGDFEVRVTVLGHLQRGGSPVPMDRLLATGFGERAARLALTGRTGRMVCLGESGDICDTDLGQAVRHTKQVDSEGDLVRTARSVGISFGDHSPKPRDRPR